MGKVDAGVKALGAWFQAHQRILPWRSEPTLYRVWVSEIMLQQTQVVTVVPYFEKFIEAFPSVEVLAGASDEQVMERWAGLGYYSRARNLARGARQIVTQGGFPTTREGWEAIPGVGPYTAGAILSIALDQSEAILDGNVERVLARLRRMTRARGDSIYKRRLWNLSGYLVRKARRVGGKPSEFNQALMELGAKVCTPRSPKCGLCPVSEFCRARHEGDAEAYPPKKAPKEWVKVSESDVLLIDSHGRVLLEKKPEGQWRSGLWDLPVSEAEISAEWLGEVETRHVVTRHKIVRRTRVGRVLWGAAEASSFTKPGAPPTRWVDPASPEVPIGAAARRVLRAADGYLG